MPLRRSFSNPTAKRRQVVAWAFVVAACAPFLGWTAPGFAQAAPVGDRPVFLNRKSAGRLLVDKPKPDYPPLARINFIQGRVRVRILVSQDGQVTEAHVLSGHPILAAAALADVQRWRYTPYRTSAGPREFVTDVEVGFTLRVKDIQSLPTAPEADFERQIHPPRVLSQPADPGGPDNLPRASSIHMRVLVSEEGKALDVDPAPGFPSKFEDLRGQFAHWTFQPARFGSLAVPWYLEVEIPAQNGHAANGAHGGG
jgi:TonB family protein